MVDKIKVLGKEYVNCNVQSNMFMRQYMAVQLPCIYRHVLGDIHDYKTCMSNHICMFMGFYEHLRTILWIPGFLGIAIFILIPGYLTCEQRNLVIFCLCMCTFFEAAGFIGGYTCNPVDMAPK